MRLKKKHIAAIALSVAICVGATGCKSEEVKNTDPGCSSDLYNLLKAVTPEVREKALRN